MSSNPAKKQAARPSRPAARYWKGKAPKGIADVDTDSDAEEVATEEVGDISLAGEQDIQNEDEDEVQLRPDVTKISKAAINITLKDVNISKDGKVIVAGREESGRTAMEEGLSIG